jgi:hypothetical protein
MFGGYRLSVEAQRFSDFPRRLRVDFPGGKGGDPFADPNHGMATLAAPPLEAERKSTRFRFVAKFGNEWFCLKCH